MKSGFGGRMAGGFHPELSVADRPHAMAGGPRGQTTGPRLMRIPRRRLHERRCRPRRSSTTHPATYISPAKSQIITPERRMALFSSPGDPWAQFQLEDGAREVAVIKKKLSEWTVRAWAILSQIGLYWTPLPSL